VLGSSMFALRTVTVDGASRISVQRVLAEAALPTGRSLLLVDPTVVAQRVEQLPAVASAQVSRRWPHTLVIHVVERRPVGVVVGAGSATLLDAHGVAFASVPSAPAGLVRVEVPGAVPGSGTAAAQAAMRVVTALPQAIRHRVEQVQASSPDDVALVLAGDRTVTWGSATDNAKKAKVLQMLLRRKAHHYDVSVPSVAVIG
jgi:cell division protein FtsQ